METNKIVATFLDFRSKYAAFGTGDSRNNVKMWNVDELPMLGAQKGGGGKGRKSISSVDNRKFTITANKLRKET